MRKIDAKEFLATCGPENEGVDRKQLMNKMTEAVSGYKSSIKYGLKEATDLVLDWLAEQMTDEEEFEMLEDYEDALDKD